jgi:hypothetical protein
MAMPSVRSGAVLDGSLVERSFDVAQHTEGAAETKRRGQSTEHQRLREALSATRSESSQENRLLRQEPEAQAQLTR